jgi:hypothetical protein
MSPRELQEVQPSCEALVEAGDGLTQGDFRYPHEGAPEAGGYLFEQVRPLAGYGFSPSANAAGRLEPVGYSFRLTSSFRLRRLQRASSVRSRRALRRSASGDGGAAGAFSGLRASWVACRVCGLSALYFI